MGRIKIKMKSLSTLVVSTAVLLLSPLYAKDVNMDNTENVKRHKDDFRRIDTNQDGLLDAIEIKEFYSSIQIFLNQEDMSAFFIASDKNEDGVIDEEEYV